MKPVAILLLLALGLSGCGGNSSSATQQAAGGIWQAQMLGGEGQASGFSFDSQFSVSGSGGSLSISSFEFLTAGSCFPLDGGTVSGSMMLTLNQTTYEVTGPISFAVSSGGNTLTLTGSVTGTENGVNGTTLSGGMATGTWSLTGGTGCNDLTGGSFTMTQSSSN
jgi:hypothetical protein